MQLPLHPLGEPRVVFFNYQEGQTPEELVPEIVLVRPKETTASAFYTGRFWENLGVMVLASHLEEAGVRLGVLEASLFQCGPAQTADLATQSRPRLIGLSVFSTDLLDECLGLAAEIEKRQPGVPIVLGGHGASFVHRDILEHHPCVTGVIRGEGEHSLLELTKRSGPECWDGVAGLSYRHADEIRVNPPAPIERDLDRASLPHRFVRDLMESDSQLSLNPQMIVSSRGCFDRCSFCTVTSFYAGKWRGRSPGHVVDELEELLGRYRRNSVHFWDDTFTGPGRVGKRRAIAIADEIKRRGLELSFHVTTRPSDLDEEVVEALASAGLCSVFLGVESSDQDTLDYFDKHAKVEHSTAAIDLLWRHGIHRILVGFILFHPRMSFEGFRRDLDFLDDLPYAEIMRICSALVFHPGATLWHQHREVLGKEAYKKDYRPPLPNAELEQLYRICTFFHGQTSGIELVMICLEERHLHDLDTIDFLAECRTRLWRSLSAAARRIASALESGGPTEELANQLGNGIFFESMRVLNEMQRRLGGEYFELLLSAYRLQNYQRFLEAPNGDGEISQAAV